jgi:hypothetical protein
MAHQIHIPEPCHEDWDNMLPEADGRHCLQCCKTVVDFTGWEVDAIADYLKSAQGNTCGRFTSDQVQIPSQPEPEELARYVIRASMPLYRKLAAMIILFFGLSVSACDAQKTTGEPAVTQRVLGDTVYAQQPPPSVTVMGAVPVPVHTIVDTTRPLRPLMGKPVVKHTVKGRVATSPKVKAKPKPMPVAGQKPPAYLQGDVQIVDPSPPPQMQAPEESQVPRQKK